MSSVKVLVALDPTRPQSGVLRMLRHLAGDAAQLTGLYVEDEDLLRAATLPGVREVSIHTRTVAAFDGVDLRRRIDEQAEAVRRAFEDAVADLEHRFLLERGRPMEALERAAREHDLVVITRAAAEQGLRMRPGRDFASAIASGADVLFVNEPWDSGRTVLVVAAAGDQAERALGLARRLADAEKIPVVIGGDAATTDGSIARIVALCEENDARVLVLPAGSAVDWKALLPRLVDELSCSLLLVAER